MLGKNTNVFLNKLYIEYGVGENFYCYKNETISACLSVMESRQKLLDRFNLNFAKSWLIFPSYHGMCMLGECILGLYFENYGALFHLKLIVKTYNICINKNSKYKFKDQALIISSS